MTDEHPIIQNRDWRLQAITTTTSEATLRPGTVIPFNSVVEVNGFVKLKRETIRIPTPAPAAIFLSAARQARDNASHFLTHDLPQMIETAHDGTKQYPFHEDTMLFDVFQYLSATVIFSYTAIEVFANETIPDDYVYEPEKKSRGGILYVKILDKPDIQRYVSLNEKLDKIMPIICQVKSPMGTRIWEHYTRLQDIRHMLIHPKTEQWKISSPDKASDYLWTWVISPQAQEAPETAFALIQHYLTNNKPRWVRKVEQQSNQ